MINGIPGLPIFFGYIGENEDAYAKLYEAQYEMFVNGDYVGDHTLYAEKEEATDIADFLETQGFSHIEIDVEGDHILINCQTEKDAERVEEAVKVFLHNR
ncbi:hypothetical protein K8O68_02930 [Salipaludibacillus sp. CUR1]|uniref:hypothetical protein n=1 Tax=Salipaludibacillus sp. CUR1 TaxID=2820003 RepID=UPI001E5C8C83|nr:hypothetical protein [Salipaludibacillus sp. CUR1]MCE7791376.1 hypothetical protein [Salipaludibacillus sp. CUR1]